MRLRPSMSPDRSVPRASPGARALLLLVGAALLVGACGRPFDVASTARFVELEEESEVYDYRATTADGVVVGIRAVDVDPDRGGNLAFWVEAIEQRMRRIGGYALLRKTDTRAGGLRGKRLEFGRDEGERPYRYWVSLFLDDDTLYVCEAGGGQETFERHARHVESLLASLRP